VNKLAVVGVFYTPTVIKWCVLHANYSEFIHNYNPLTEDDPYGVNLENAS